MSIQNESTDEKDLRNALLDLDSAMQFGARKSPLPALAQAVADETPAVKGR